MGFIPPNGTVVNGDLDNRPLLSSLAYDLSGLPAAIAAPSSGYQSIAYAALLQ
jgi:hypothetical protein